MELYYQDAYLREFEATVTAREGEAIALSNTAFYPSGGGQPHDCGVIRWAEGEEASVVDVRRTNAQIWHTLDRKTLPAVGELVQASLDWERRHLLMRTHTAMHILCGVIWRDYRASVTGGNMTPGRGRMDFEFAEMSRDLVDAIQQSINAEVLAGRTVRAAFLAREKAFDIPDLIRTKINLLPEHIQEVRIVEIVGLDLQADGGTHVANTAEVGSIKIADYKSKGAINKRLVVELEG
ncbi:MAG: alanyl-tRNA editing protein [Anaerolineales bacterium]|nr:alanyl-tRNA editing protein [Anaerolineales bacterium]